MYNNIRHKLAKGLRLNKREVDYIKDKYLPKYQANCGHCRFNLRLAFNIRLK